MKWIPVFLAYVTMISVGAAYAQDATMKSLPPSVVKTVPACGDMAVDAAATTRIETTFSKDMADESWSFVQMSPATFPAASNPRYLPDKRTCVIDVKLESSRTYVIWFNSETKRNFMDADGNPLVPYLLVFRTK